MLTDKEAEIYDRQIRLWGVEAQKRMRSARVLVVGLGALGAEVVKNLVLAGINLVLADEEKVTDADLGINFFLAPTDIGTTRSAACLPRVREMNTLVTVDALAKAVTELTDEELAGFRLVVHCGGCPGEQLALAARCRSLSVPVAIANLYGFWGAFALDFGRHTFTREITKPATASGAAAAGEPTVVTSTVTVEYMPLQDVIAAPWDKVTPTKKDKAAAFFAWLAATASTVGLGPACASSAATALEKAKEYAVAASAKGLTTVHADALEAFCTQAGVELIPVAAVVAGQLGQEVVKLLSGKDEPLQNVFLFDAMGGGGGSVFRIDN